MKILQFTEAGRLAQAVTGETEQDLSLSELTLSPYFALRTVRGM